MARWRAVPTAVWTAVGALAFLASTGLAVVLGAGLHVWSGPLSPAAPPSAQSAGRPGSSSGVVTVAPPPVARPASPHSAGPVSSLPVPAFVPFTTAPAPAPGSVAIQPPAPAAPAGPGHSRRLSHPQPFLIRALLRLPLELRTALLAGTDLRLAGAPSEPTLLTAGPLPKVHAHPALHIEPGTDAARPHHHARHHSRHTAEADRRRHGHGHDARKHGHAHRHHEQGKHQHGKHQHGED